MFNIFNLIKTNNINDVIGINLLAKLEGKELISDKYRNKVLRLAEQIADEEIEKLYKYVLRKANKAIEYKIRNSYYVFVFHGKEYSSNSSSSYCYGSIEFPWKYLKKFIKKMRSEGFKIYQFNFLFFKLIKISWK